MTNPDYEAISKALEQSNDRMHAGEHNDTVKVTIDGIDINVSYSGSRWEHTYLKELAYLKEIRDLRKQRDETYKVLTYTLDQLPPIPVTGTQEEIQKCVAKVAKYYYEDDGR